MHSLAKVAHAAGACALSVGGSAHLHQGLLHGGPVGYPPSTLQDEVGVYVTFGLAVFRQSFPLVQLLRAPRRSGIPAKTSVPTPTGSESGGWDFKSFISIL